MSSARTSPNASSSCRATPSSRASLPTSCRRNWPTRARRPPRSSTPRSNKLARVLNSPAVKRVLLNDSLRIDLDRLIERREVLVVRGALGRDRAGQRRRADAAAARHARRRARAHPGPWRRHPAASRGAEGRRGAARDQRRLRADARAEALGRARDSRLLADRRAVGRSSCASSSTRCSPTACCSRPPRRPTRATPRRC